MTALHPENNQASLAIAQVERARRMRPIRGPAGRAIEADGLAQITARRLPKPPLPVKHVLILINDSILVCLAGHPHSRDVLQSLVSDGSTDLRQDLVNFRR